MKISLIHPSRGRAKKAYQTYQHWLSLAIGVHTIEHIVSVDFDDKEFNKYVEIFKDTSILVTNYSSDVVSATNNAAKLATGDILIYLSDDFSCPKYWDKFIVNAMPADTPALIKVDDCLQKFHVDVLTIPIMNRALYDKLGYFWNPLYKSMFVDQDLYWVCHNNGWLIFMPELKFEHKHYSIGKSLKDETYTRSDKNWDHGKEIYQKRKSQNFPL